MTSGDKHWDVKISEYNRPEGEAMPLDRETRLPLEPTDGHIWTLCRHAINAECKHCPATVSTAYGEGTQGCRAMAEDAYRALLAEGQPAQGGTLARPEETVRVALRNLMKESAAMLALCEPELREVAGHTNVAVFLKRITEAGEALTCGPQEQSPSKEKP